VSQPRPWTDQQSVTVQLSISNHGASGTVVLCLDRRKQHAKIVDHGSGDGLDPGCVPLAGLERRDR